jgi:hypothetical protein
MEKFSAISNPNLRSPSFRETAQLARIGFPLATALRLKNDSALNLFSSQNDYLLCSSFAGISEASATPGSLPIAPWYGRANRFRTSNFWGGFSFPLE